MSNTSTRVRFAPSPTGLLHIGNARTALFNWLFAKKRGGRFILRIENTDMERSSKEFEEAIIDDLQWLGIQWDEGPDKEGNHALYRQSERLNVYKEYAEKLLKEEKAYPCFCSSEELEVMRHSLLSKGKTPRYNRRCLQLSKEERDAYIRNGRKYAIRFHVRENQKNIEFTDLIKGRISFGKGSLQDFILLRSDFVASYNFAVVLDDAQMGITHVIRGDDHLSNTPKQILLYNALGFPMPQFAHLPMILDDDKRPLRKRGKSVAISTLREEGFLRETVINGIILLGWSSEDHREILPLEDIKKYFSLKRVARSPAVFDIQKFRWINKHYLKHKEPEEMIPLLVPYLKKKGININTLNKDTLLRIAEVVRDNVDTLSQTKDYTDMLLGDTVPITDEELTILKQKSVQDIIANLKKELEYVDEVTEATYHTIISHLKRKTGVHGKGLFMPIRMVITGRTQGPELVTLFSILKKDVIMKRIENVLKLTTN